MSVVSSVFGLKFWRLLKYGSASGLLYAWLHNNPEFVDKYVDQIQTMSGIQEEENKRE
eukprot:CAMPEP_0116893214 /NCGR_PEP_ID=MMETSP0467-20121206/3254_1 /TAXON_ID=283647 /ORGANISM="Mesodinium pulex, Strain SPMC105" /LENGTH=57 /DNA_ID=CAMNT_0004562753 /DNA_START=450 /DNA_END=623 /DNA_ORIENTATION=+